MGGFLSSIRMTRGAAVEVLPMSFRPSERSEKGVLPFSGVD